MSAITPQFAMPRDMSGYSDLEAALEMVGGKRSAGPVRRGVRQR